MEYGYVRVSTAGQNVERQLRTMAEAGVAEGSLFVDRASGRDMDRPEWLRLMSVVRPGDRITVDSLDRLGRSYADVTREWRRLVGEGVDLRCLDLEFFDSARFREMGEIGACVQDMLLSLLSYAAEHERLENRRRQAEGIAAARERGAYRGRSASEFPEEALSRAREALASRGKQAAADELGVSRSTVYRMVAEGRL